VASRNSWGGRIYGKHRHTNIQNNSRRGCANRKSIIFTKYTRRALQWFYQYCLRTYERHTFVPRSTKYSIELYTVNSGNVVIFHTEICASFEKIVYTCISLVRLSPYCFPNTLYVYIYIFKLTIYRRITPVLRVFIVLSKFTFNPLKPFVSVN